MTAFYSPSRGLHVWLAGVWQRYRCGRRFGHFPCEDEFGNSPSCSRCGGLLL